MPSLSRRTARYPGDTTTEPAHYDGRNARRVAYNVSAAPRQDRVIVDATPDNLNGSCEQVVRRRPHARQDSSENKQELPREDNASAQE